MSTPAPPPRKHKKTDDRSYTAGSAEKSLSMLGSGLGILQQLSRASSRGGDERIAWASATPESVVGPEVVISGELKFDNLLRIDGRFEGKLITKGGNVVVGSSGVLVGDVNNVSAMIVGGKVTGNILVDSLHLRGEAAVHGDVSCKSITIGPNAVVCGRLNVHPQAPRLIDSNGAVVAAPPRPALSRKSSLRGAAENGAAPARAPAAGGTEAEWGSTAATEKQPPLAQSGEGKDKENKPAPTPDPAAKPKEATPEKPVPAAPAPAAESAKTEPEAGAAAVGVKEEVAAAEEAPAEAEAPRGGFGDATLTFDPAADPHPSTAAE